MLEQAAAGFQQGQGFASGQGFGELQQLLLRHRPQQLPHGGRLNRRWQQAELIQQALGIAQAPLGPLGHHVQGFGGDADLFLLGDPAQVPLQGLQRNAAEVEALAAAQDGGQHPLGVGGGQHEHHPRRRLLQGFEQGVEGGGGEHVALVHHIHLPAGLHGCEAGALDQLADVVDTGVGGGVDLDHIEGIACGDAGAQLAHSAGIRGGAVAGDAVERAGQDAGAGGFAGAAGATEQVGRGNAARAQRMGEGGGDGLLPHQLVEALGPVFVVEGLVGRGHGAAARTGCRLHATGPSRLVPVCGFQQAPQTVVEGDFQFLHLGQLVCQLLGCPPQRLKLPLPPAGFGAGQFLVQFQLQALPQALE